MFPYTFTAEKITVFLNRRSFSVLYQDNPERYEQALSLLKEGNDDEETWLSVMEPEPVQALKQVGGIQFVNGAPLYHGQPLNGVLGRKILEIAKAGLSIDMFAKFLDNLHQNPSARSVRELYDFLEHQNLPLTEDGHFLAYKSVQANYLDWHSGKFDNSPGKVLEISRNQVDDDREQECSFGFHVGAMSYAQHFGSGSRRIMLVKVNPKDAVSVPRDHDATKLRVCRYEVLREVDAPITYDSKEYPRPALSIDSDDDDDHDDGDDRCDDCGCEYCECYM